MTPALDLSPANGPTRRLILRSQCCVDNLPLHSTEMRFQSVYSCRFSRYRCRFQVLYQSSLVLRARNIVRRQRRGCQHPQRMFHPVPTLSQSLPLSVFASLMILPKTNATRYETWSHASMWRCILSPRRVLFSWRTVGAASNWLPKPRRPRLRELR